MIRRSATFAGLPPERIIEVLSTVNVLKTDFSVPPELSWDTLNLKVTGAFPPDFLEMAASSHRQSFMLRIFLLPVDSEQGTACQIFFEIVDITGDLQSTEMVLLTEIGRRLREAGATRVKAMPLTSITGDRYTSSSLPVAISAVSDFTCLRHELRDAANELIVRWRGILVWASPKSGLAAVRLHYTSFCPGIPGGVSKHLFLRWVFFVDKKTGQVEVTYECSSPDASLSDPHSTEWRVVKEMVKLTRKHLCRAGAASLSDRLSDSQAVAIESPVENASAAAARQDKAQVRLAELKFKRDEANWALLQFWPSAQDYNEAIQNLPTCTDDPEIKAGELCRDVLGLPVVVSGAFASVYRVRSGGRQLAVRCFVRPVRDQAERYRRISSFICSDDLPYTLDAHFVEKGILVRGQWFPVIKMEWIEGDHLNDFVSDCLGKPLTVSSLRTKFWRMLIDLAAAGVAHGDLQHGNVIIKDGQFILLDYDGMYVPDLWDHSGREKGHPNYQHPDRGPMHFGPHIDNFSAWVIDTALLCVQEDPSLWERFGAGDESLLFRRADFIAPHESELFRALTRHQSAELRARVEYLRALLAADVDRVPALAPGYPELARPVKKAFASLPDWLNLAEIS
jgi:hypothetical protein